MKLHLLCLLAALPLIASDDLSKLTECVCTHGKDCNNNICSVSEHGACVTVAAETNLGNTTVSATYKTCVNKSESCIKGVVSISANGEYWRSNTTCCHKNKCNDKNFTAPPAIHTQSKLTCPSCFGHDASSCKPVNVICAESETECITIHGYIIEESPEPTTKPSTTTERSKTTESHTSTVSSTTKSTTHTTSKHSDENGKKDKVEGAVILIDKDPSKEKSTTQSPSRHRPFYARGCGTKEGILGTGIPLTLQHETFYFSNGNPGMVAGNMAFAIILPSFIVFLVDKFFN